jgi:3-oxoacyl-[acyl-carrier-protein] synthase-3
VSTPVGITAISTYFPEGYQTSAEIAAATGIPAEVIEAKFGLRGKHVAGPDEHISDLAIRAARPLMADSDPRDIGAVIYFGSAHKDYYLWSCAPKIAHALNLDHAFTFELMDTSACGPVALRVARDMLVADTSLSAILLVGASRESSVINYRNERSRFAFNFGDGAAAALVRRGAEGHLILSGAALTDGAFADSVYIPAGGSVHPASAETLERGMHYLDVPDPLGMKARLDPVSLDRFVETARRAVEAAGFTLDEIDFLAPLHMKRSIYEAILGALGLEPRQSFYLEEFGHMSAIDPFVIMEEAENRALVSKGDLVVALAAGTGYSWTAAALLW